jgi:hypothetical protein
MRMFLVTGALAVTTLCACTSAPPATPAASATAPADMIMVRQTAKTPDQAVDAIKSYAESQKWAYLGANKVKNGEVTLVKVCIPAVGAVVWTAGLEHSALLPCGNVAVYQKGGRTEIAMLDPRYMGVLSPRPELARAGDMARPLLTQMLETAAR